MPPGVKLLRGQVLLTPKRRSLPGARQEPGRMVRNCPAGEGEGGGEGEEGEGGGEGGEGEGEEEGEIQA